RRFESSVRARFSSSDFGRLASARRARDPPSSAVSSKPPTHPAYLVPSLRHPLGRILRPPNNPPRDSTRPLPLLKCLLQILLACLPLYFLSQCGHSKSMSAFEAGPAGLRV
ncbi:hypothetical protein RTBOTA2_003312, partial [Rhodotorula toruloides]